MICWLRTAIFLHYPSLLIKNELGITPDAGNLKEHKTAQKRIWGIYCGESLQNLASSDLTPTLSQARDEEKISEESFKKSLSDKS